eukprot:gb/GEZN01006596.1/.p1 GENE.gb/GEZN01006596.1/~~gb/GEZN01006596.1/.p1  ORF type:complete len:356 (+),score=57.38 gb/GEZN01006596.1/:78-1145(+)
MDNRSNPFNTGGGENEEDLAAMEEASRRTEETMADPFEDSSIADASAYAHSAEEYNPFASGDDLSWQQQEKRKQQAAKKKQHTTQHSTAYGMMNGQQQAPRQKPMFPGEEDIILTNSRAADLERRERLLAQREAEIKLREKEARALMGNRLPPNWPLECYSVAYHDIDAEIPQGYQLFVKQLYAYIILVWLSMGWNWLLMTMAWFSGVQNYTSGDTDFMWSSLYLVLGMMGSWKLWYRSVYYGCRDGSSRQWLFFFPNFFAHLVFAAVMAVGVPKCAAGGLMFMIKMFASRAAFLGWAAMTNTMLWTAVCLLGVTLSKKAHRVWKHSGMPEQTRRSVAEAVVKESLTQGLIDREN